VKLRWTCMTLFLIPYCCLRTRNPSCDAARAFLWSCTRSSYFAVALLRIPSATTTWLSSVFTLCFRVLIAFSTLNASSLSSLAIMSSCDENWKLACPDSSTRRLTSFSDLRDSLLSVVNELNAFTVVSRLRCLESVVYPWRNFAELMLKDLLKTNLFHIPQQS